jgi:serine/threonine-protein kinase SRPK3
MVCLVSYGTFFLSLADEYGMPLKVFENLTGAALFRLYESPSVTLFDSHLQRMIEHIGDFPLSFLAGCSRRDEHFSEQGEDFQNIPCLDKHLNFFAGKLFHVKKLFPRTIEECMAQYKHIDDKDIAPAATFIRRCLTIDPSVRPSASELLQDEWFGNV